MTTPVKRFFQNAHRRPEDEPAYYDAPPRGLQPPLFMRTTDYRENLVNLVTFYASYVVMLASAAVVIYFSLQDQSSFNQSISVQAFPDVVFAWNADPAATTLPTVSVPGSGGQASCTPDYWSRGSYLAYDCTSIASDAREKLVFSVYSTTPFPATIKTYRNPSLKYPDIEVKTYYISYSTFVPPTTTTIAVAGGAASAPAFTSTPATSSPAAARRAADKLVAATPSSAPLQARQDSGATPSTITPIPSSSSLPLRKLEYPSSSISALAAGTIVSRGATPPPSSTSIVVSTAKLKQSFYLTFIVVAAVSVLLATITTLLVSYNLSVARKKVWPPEASYPATRRTEPIKDTAQTRKKSDRKKDKPISPTLPRHRSHDEASGAKTGTKAIDPTRKSASRLDRGRRGDVTHASTEVAPPAYQERDDSVAHLATWFSQGEAGPAQDDAIDVASILSGSTISGGSNRTADIAERIAARLADDNAPSYEHVRVDPCVPLKTRTDGSRLSLRLAWFILPSYTYLYLWDMVLFVVLLIFQVTVVGLAGDGLMNVGTFVRSGSCLGEPSRNDSVYELQRKLCSSSKFLSAFPLAYSAPSPAATLTRVGGDLLALVFGLTILFLSYLTWIIALLRKSHLTHRDGMEPHGNDEGKRYTGRSRWTYFTVWNKLGTHGWSYDESTELQPHALPEP